MRILYFSNISFAPQKSHYNGGGWISAFLSAIKKYSNNQVAVCFLGDENKKWQEDDVSYFQIAKCYSDSRLKKTISDINILFGNYKSVELDTWYYYEEKIKSIILDFKPDVNHIFGSEQVFGLAGSITSVPTILHIQGYLNPIENALFPPTMSWKSLNKWTNPKTWIQTRYLSRIWEMQCMREREILKRVHNYIGRTEWDKRVTFCFNSKANYYYGSEILRDEFYLSHDRNLPEQFIIISTISDATYKGYDMILKTADVLRNLLKMDFQWKVFGNINPSPIEFAFQLFHKDLNVQLMGVADSATLQKELLSSTCYMHPSYIDNSPNSLCESQVLGVPVVACNVGGLSSLVENGKTGYLVPSNDSYQAAFLLRKLFIDRNDNIMIGDNSKRVALRRHDRQIIIRNVIDVYEQLLNNNSKNR